MKMSLKRSLGSPSRRAVWMMGALALVLVMVAITTGVLLAPAEQVSAATQQFTSPAQAVAEVLGPSVVNIKIADGQGYGGEGSGVIYSEDGMIITNNHVVINQYTGQPVSSMTVTLATGEQLDATLVGHDPTSEIAVIKVDATDLPAAEFTNAPPQVGEYAVAIGSPLGYDNSVTLGVISGLGRQVEGVRGDEATALSNLIQTDAPISPGNSGGALADSNARVIGVNVAYEPPAQTGAVSIGFAIPAATATKVADQLISNGVVDNGGNNNGGNSDNVAPEAYLGVGTIDVTPLLQQQYGLTQSSGALVAEVAQASPAEEAGLQQGDIIIGADGKVITSTADLFALDQSKDPGDQVELTVDRGGDLGEVTVTLGERPASAY